MDIYAQRVTADGVIPSGWPADGVPVCADSANQDGPRIVSDGAGGAYVAWLDRRDYFPVQRTDLYIQRLTPEGAIAPGWAVNGNVVCAVPGDQWRHRVAPDGAGGAFVVWEDTRRDSSLSGGSQTDLYAQRITPEGKLAPGWPVDGRPVCTAPGDRCCENVMPDGLGGLFIGWADGRNLVTSDIYALRITAAGDLAPGWAADGNPICTAPGHQTLQVLPSPTPDGVGGFIIAWLDARSAAGADVHLDDDAGVSGYFDIYAQRVTADGNIAPGWPDNGAPVCTAPELQQDHRLISDGAGGAIVVWSDYRDQYVTGSDLYAQRLLGSGQIAPGWPLDGVALRRGPGYELSSTVVADGAGGALVALEGTSATEYNVYLQHVTASGAIAPGWDQDGVRLCKFDSQQHPVAVSDGKMGMIVAWDDCRPGDCGIYAQRVGGDFPTPTLLSLVNAEVEPGRVVLTWFAGATRPSAAMVYRRGTNSDWVALGAPHDAGDGLLVFEDRSVGEGRYAYRLGYAGDGGEVFTPEEWVTVPSGYALSLAGFSPNPAMGEPVVSFSLPSREGARLEVFDVSGRVVFAQEVGSLGPGVHRVAIGGEVKRAPGVTWLRLTQGGRSLTAKGLIMR